MILFFCLVACNSEKSRETEKASVPVRVANATRETITSSITAVGNVQPSVSVTITPRVDGEIMQIYFTEGEDVTEGQHLLQIDPRPYAANLAEKRANLAKSQAQLLKARHDRSRYAKLVTDGYVSKESFEQTETDAMALAATVDANKAAVDRAALELSYCDIVAPISGRIGELKMHKGNMVKNNDSGPITTINTISPSYITFSVPEARLAAVMEYMRNSQLPVTATTIGGAPESGVLTLIDNNVDTKTGSIRLRATFPNAEKKLWPGQFVEVHLPLSNLDNTIVVPSRAVLNGREGSYVYVVTPDNRAEYRLVKKLFEVDGRMAIDGKIEAGDRVITEGQVRLSPGMAVHVID